LWGTSVILIIDNYDSFTYNLVQALGEMGCELRVYRNDKVTLDEIASLAPERIIISPGPCTPDEAGISNDVIRRFAGKMPIMGVCLGHQCIAAAMGGKVVRAGRLMHGKTSMIHHDGEGVFRGIPSPFAATRYHSLIVPRDGVPEGFVISAWTDRDEIMGIRREDLELTGVQFHPESFLTLEGPTLLANFAGVERPAVCRDDR